MNNMPGFTAETSLYTPNKHQHFVRMQQQPPSANTVQPAGIYTYAACVAACCAFGLLPDCSSCFEACEPALNPKLPVTRPEVMKA